MFKLEPGFLIYIILINSDINRLFIWMGFGITLLITKCWHALIVQILDVIEGIEWVGIESIRLILKCVSLVG